MVGLSQGKYRGCKDSIGGVNKVYIFSFAKHPRSQIVYNDMVLTSFPPTNLYEFETSNTPNFLNTPKEDEGGKYYNEDISFEFVSNVDGGGQFENFLKKDLRCIIKDYNGKYRLLGAFNGLICDKVSRTTGSSRSSLNGYRISLTGQELLPSLYINDLYSAGFNISGLYNFVFNDNNNFVFNDNNNFKFN